MNETIYWIWLSSLLGIGPGKANRLLQLYEYPWIIFHLTEQQLKNTGFLTEKNIIEIMDDNKRRHAETIFQTMYKKDIGIITIKDSAYPKRLRDIFQPPVALFYTGKLEFSETSIAIVGSRRTTRYGANTAKRLGYDLSMRGIQIISGLARGIDSFAHLGSVEAGGKTIAVLGCGPDIVYPVENTKLYSSIRESGGVILSEYPPGTPPLTHHFPARNRIISGLSDGVLVVEAAERSGSLITATLALEQGKEVFAVPGNIDTLLSTGTNQLIRDGAKIVLSAQDVLDEICSPVNSTNCNCNSAAGDKNFKLFKGLDTNEIRIVKAILRGCKQPDEIIEETSINSSDVISTLFILEMKGVIEQLSGHYYEVK